MQTVAASSGHPIAAYAVGEVVGAIGERLDRIADLVCLFASAHHTGALEDIVAAVDELLAPGVLIGTTTAAVLGPDALAINRPGLSVLATTFEAGSVTAMRYPFSERGGRPLVFFADPHSIAPDELLDELLDDVDDGSASVVVGALASAGRGPGGNRLVLGRDVFSDGAVGVAFTPPIAVTPVIATGHRYCSTSLPVTRAERSIVHELAGRPAHAQMLDCLAALSARQRQAAVQPGVFACEVIEADGEPVVRAIVGVDRSNGALALDGRADDARSLRFTLIDADRAEAQLHAQLALARPRAALVFANGVRGPGRLGRPDAAGMVTSGSVATSSGGPAFQHRGIAAALLG